jgi:hypothetical protein
MMSNCCSKHVETWNKYIKKKECVKLVINQNYVEMQGQQNIKMIFEYLTYMSGLFSTTFVWNNSNSKKN